MNRGGEARACGMNRGGEARACGMNRGGDARTRRAWTRAAGATLNAGGIMPAVMDGDLRPPKTAERTPPVRHHAGAMLLA